MGMLSSCIVNCIFFGLHALGIAVEILSFGPAKGKIGTQSPTFKFI